MNPNYMREREREGSFSFFKRKTQNAIIFNKDPNIFITIKDLMIPNQP
jgi:hypothetical protein